MSESAPGTGTTASGSASTSPSASSSAPSASAGSSTQTGGNLPASDQPSSSGMKMDHADKVFAVSNVEMVSSTCDINK
jgi:hypothetical protein